VDLVISCNKPRAAFHPICFSLVLIAMLQLIASVHCFLSGNPRAIFHSIACSKALIAALQVKTSAISNLLGICYSNLPAISQMPAPLLHMITPLQLIASAFTIHPSIIWNNSRALSHNVPFSQALMTESKLITSGYGILKNSSKAISHYTPLLQAGITELQMDRFNSSDLFGI